MFIYDNLTDRELDNYKRSRLGDILRSTGEIGRDAVIKELRKYDVFELMRKKDPAFVVATTKKKVKELGELRRFVLWHTSRIQFHMPLREFLKQEPKA